MIVPIEVFLHDVLFISGELVTGKSIPVLMGITRLPIDQFLACLVLSVGAVAGTLFSSYASQAVAGMHRLVFANRLLQLFFSLCLSLSLLLSVARGIHSVRGVILSLIPAFCVVAQTLPQRPSTALVSFLATAFTFYYCMTTHVSAGADPDDSNPAPAILLGLGAEDPEAEATRVWDVALRALQLFNLAFYASVQHAPTQIYYGREVRNDVAASRYHADYPRYALFVGMVSALLRVCTWYGVCLFQNNAFHVILENDHALGGWDWMCCVYMTVTLLYSACWTATLLREQVLPFFGNPSNAVRLKLVVAALSLAALYRQRDPQIVFYATAAQSVVCVAVAILTLK
jgi:hypothetical protein